MKIEKYTLDLLDINDVFTEIPDLQLIVLVNRIIEIKGRMVGLPDVFHDPVEGFPT